MSLRPPILLPAPSRGRLGVTASQSSSCSAARRSRGWNPPPGAAILQPDRKLCNVLKLQPRARPNCKPPSVCHFESGRSEMATAGCRCSRSGSGRAGFQKGEGTSRGVLPVPQARVRRRLGGEFRRERTSGALSPASTWGPDPRAEGGIRKLESGRGGPAPPSDHWCRRPQDRTWPRT